jgi:hypothetical protein
MLQSPMRIPSTLIFLLLCLPARSQTADNTRYTRHNRPAYIEVGAGLSSSAFADFATSPLGYNTRAPRFTAGIIRMDPHMESRLAASYLSGTFTVTADRRRFVSQVNTVFLSYARLYAIPKLSTQKLRVKAGGMLDLTGNIRINNSLNNNATGAEMINTLFVSGKAEYDVSRVRAKSGKLLGFIPYNLQPRQRWLTCQLNAAVINNAYRNGYAYLNPTAVANHTELFYDYRYRWLSGYRMSSSLEYNLYYTNGNIIRLSYLWDAYHTGGSTDRFQMAHHYLQASLLFRLK